MPSLPDFNRFVQGGAHEVFWVLRVERDGSDPIGVVHESQHPLLSFYITKVHVKVFTSTYECCAIRGKFEASDPSSMVI